MAPTYEYVCRVCGTTVELDRPLTDEARHVHKDKTVCGTLRRVWSTINVNKHNLRKAH